MANNTNAAEFTKIDAGHYDTTIGLQRWRIYRNGQGWHVYCGRNKLNTVRTFAIAKELVDAIHGGAIVSAEVAEILGVPINQTRTDR